MVTFAQAGGASETCLLTRSSTESRPRSSSSRIAAAVNCLVTEPMRNFVAGELGISHSRFADPYPLFSRTLSPRATSTAPMNRLFGVKDLHRLLHAGDVLPEDWRGDDEDDCDRSSEDCEAEEARHGTSRVFVSGRRRPASEQDLH